MPRSPRTNRTSTQTRERLTAQTELAELRARKVRADARAAFFRGQHRLTLAYQRALTEFRRVGDRLVSSPAARPIQPDRYSSARRDNRVLSRSEARELAAFNYCAASMVGCLRDNVIGHGMSLRSDAPDPAMAAAYTQHIERLCLRDLDPRGRSLYQLQRLLYTDAYVCGDSALLLLATGRVQFVSSDRIVTPRHPDPLDSGFEQVDGVVVEPDGSPRAFYIDCGGADAVRYAARDVVHYVHRRLHPEDIRGTPAFASVFTLLHQLEKLIDAVIAAHRAAASLGMVIQRENASLYAAAAASQVREEKWQPGQVLYLEPGESSQQVAAEHPGQNFAGLVRVILQLVGLSERIPVNLMGLDFDAGSFSSALAGIMQFKKSLQPTWDDLGNGPLRRVFDRLIARGIVTGALPATPAVQAVRDRTLAAEPAEAVYAVEAALATDPSGDFTAVPPAWGYLSPVDEVQSDLMLVDSAVYSFDDICRKHGLDPKTQLEKHRQIADLAAKIGVSWPPARSTATREPMASPAPAPAPAGRAAAAARSVNRIQAGAAGPLQFGEDGQFDVLVYTGGELVLDGGLDDGQPIGRCVIDLSGLTLAPGTHPLLWSHDPERPIGVCESSTLTAEGVRTRARYVSDAAPGVPNLLRLMGVGMQVQASIGADVLRYRRVPVGETVSVNGRSFSGPITHIQAAVERETSLVTFGADGHTEVTLRKDAMPNPPTTPATPTATPTVKAAVSPEAALQLQQFLVDHPGADVSVVLEMLAEGKSLDEIAAALKLAENSTPVSAEPDQPMPATAGKARAGKGKLSMADLAEVADLYEKHPADAAYIGAKLRAGKTPAEIAAMLSDADEINATRAAAEPAQVPPVTEDVAAIKAENARLKAAGAGAQTAGRPRAATSAGKPVELTDAQFAQLKARRDPSVVGYLSAAGYNRAQKLQTR